VDRFSPDFDSFDHHGRHFGETRFPEGTPGLESVWRDTLDRIDELAESPRALHFRTKRIRRPREPRLFISHKQADGAKAKRVAWLAKNCGFNYWLDVLDPTIEWLHQAERDEKKRGIMLAAVIEMALLNSTHVIALITRKAVASRWIPYEYGRVKDHRIQSEQVACWVAPRQRRLLTEYMYLGDQLLTEQDICRWLRKRRKEFRQASRGRTVPRAKPRRWTGREPAVLPGSRT
jgi:hypothetical protein